MNLEDLFIQHCGLNVQFDRMVVKPKEIRFSYRIPKLDPDRLFFVRGVLNNGTFLAKRAGTLRAADQASHHAYRATGQMAADMEQLLQGKLVDEHPRSVS